MTEHLDELSYHKQLVDLKRKYPIALRTIFRRSWRWWVPYIAFCLCIFLINSGSFSVLDRFFSADIVTRWSVYSLALASLVVLGRLIFDAAYHFLYRYGLEAGSLVVKHGVFIVDRGSFPLPRITRLHLERNFCDLLFGLYNLSITTVPGRSASIDGLARKNAIELLDFMTSLIQSLEFSEDKSLENHIEQSEKIVELERKQFELDRLDPRQKVANSARAKTIRSERCETPSPA